MTPEISSLTGLRSGIAAFMVGDSFSHGRSALGDAISRAILLGFACPEGFRSAGRIRGVGSLCGQSGGHVAEP
jgi:hypothetical protein